MLIATVGRDTALQVLESKSNLIADYTPFADDRVTVAKDTENPVLRPSENRFDPR